MAYRVSQGLAALIIALSFFLTPLPLDAPILLPLALTMAAIFLLGSIVRILAGNAAGAISLVLLPLYPAFPSSVDGALALFCLSALIALLVTRDYPAGKNHNLALSLALTVPIALGWRIGLCFLPLSAALGFAYLLVRYVPPDSIRPYRTLLKRLRANRSCAKSELVIITVAGLLSFLPLLLLGTTRIHSAVNSVIGDPAGYLLAVARLFLEYLGLGEVPDTLPILLTPPLLVASSVTLWWLFVSVRSGTGLPFSLTAIPVSYLLCGALGLRAGRSYAHRVHPILLANLIVLLGLWWKGRANKRVLDSTTN
jgi:hypothetical protein